MTEKCVLCSAFTPGTLLCINCMLSMGDDERGQMAHECAMCGGYCASVDENGHCPSCRQIWNG